LKPPKIFVDAGVCLSKVNLEFS